MTDFSEASLKQIRSQIAGCVFAGALGDSLGYFVEFMRYSAIQKKFGPNGITELQLTGEKAVFSDDTQMTLFTMEGMKYGYRRALYKGLNIDNEYYVYCSYLRWAQTQGMKLGFEIPYDWPSELAKLPEINQRRAPGNTCLSALASGKMGTFTETLNDSKGCGGVMRTAPIGFLREFSEGESRAILNGAKVAAITHSHPLGFIPAGMLSDMVYRIIYGERKALKDIVLDSLGSTVKCFDNYPEIVYFEDLIKKAVLLSEGNDDDVTCIKMLGEGWVGEEALAIAIFTCLRYSGDFKKCLIAAVNHNGDSDSTGAIAGNILGAYLGEEALPREWMDKLELTEVINSLIDDFMRIISGAEASNIE